MFCIRYPDLIGGGGIENIKRKGVIIMKTMRADKLAEKLLKYGSKKVYVFLDEEMNGYGNIKNILMGNDDSIVLCPSETEPIAKY